jgi:branched-chain amino acid transport system permease protein
MTLADALPLFVAAAGLTIAVGWAGLPSLGQGGFVGLGAYATAIAMTRYHADPLTAVVVAIALTTAAGAVVALAVARLRPPFVAVGTWLAAWSFTLAVAAFPALTGGTRGLVLPQAQIHSTALAATIRLTDRVLLQAAALAAAATVAVVLALRPRLHPALALIRADPGTAAAAGVDVARRRIAALTASALLAGVAGALLVLSTGVAEPSAYGPLLSVELFLVVLIGGADRLAGAALGLTALAAIDPLARLLARAAGTDSFTVEPAVTGALLLAAVAVGGRGLAARLPTRRSNPALTPAPEPLHFDGARLTVTDVAVAFGGVQALDGLSLTVEPGTCHALVGANGSGKTTLLRVLAGTATPDRGRIELDGRNLTDLPPRKRRGHGLARTLQRPLRTDPQLTTLDAALAGTEPVRTTGLIRAALATPQARADQARARAAANHALQLVGLDHDSHRPVASLNGAERGLLQIAQALAGGARVLLLDEPSAGMAGPEGQALQRLLARLRDAGLTLLVVEHNASLVAALADRVTNLTPEP